MVKRGAKSRDRYISGKQGLALIDASVSRARTALDHAVRSADETAQRRGEVRQAQAQAFQALAKFRLEKLRVEDDVGDLSDAERQAHVLLEQHADFVEREYEALQDMTDKIERLEGQRQTEHTALSDIVATQEDTIQDILSELAKTSSYQSIEYAMEQAMAVTERAEQKLELAKRDREEKGLPYEADPLFSYLWGRKFRTTEYKARGLTRMLDGWVARLCGYDKAHLTYNRLTELPERLAEHVTRIQALEADAEAAVKAIESEALTEGGIDTLEADAELIRGNIRKLDEEIETAEELHLARSESHTSALSAKTGPAEKARKVLAGALHKMSFPDLRVLVAQTVELEDDEIVDELVKLRAEEIQLDLEMTDQNQLPQRRGRDLKQIEALRRGYKRASYASGSIFIDQSVLEDVMSDLHSNTLDLKKALKRIRKTIRRGDRGGRGGGYGGGGVGGYGGSGRRSRHKSYRRSRRHRRYDTAYGWEDVAATVVVELAKAAMGGDGDGINLDDFGGGSDSGGGYKTGGRF